MTDFLILGAGTAGFSAAIYAVRAGLSVKILENSVYGGQIINSSDVDNYPGIPSISGFDFIKNLHDHAAKLGVEPESASITGLSLTGETKKIETDSGVIEAKTVLIATGATHRKLNAPREELLTGRGVSYCATCDGAFFRNKEVAIVGGGNTALEDALFLSNVCETVSLIHRREEFRAHQATINAVKARKNIRFFLNRTVKEILGEQKVSGLVLQDASGQDAETLSIAGLFVAVGMIPNTAFLNGQVELEDGYVKALEDCHTNLPGVFAAGDVRTKPLRQLITAASDGAVAAVEAGKYLA